MSHVCDMYMLCMHRYVSYTCCVPVRARVLSVPHANKSHHLWVKLRRNRAKLHRLESKHPENMLPRKPAERPGRQRSVGTMRGKKLRAAKQGKALDSDHDAEGSDEPKRCKIKTKAKRAISSNDEGSPAE